MSVSQRVSEKASADLLEADDMGFVAKINQRLQQSLTKQLQPKTTTDSDKISQGEKPEISHELGKASIVDKQIQVIPPDKGRKIVFDNLDCFIEPHEMTEAHQNRDQHWVTVMETENRVSGNHLSSSVRPSQDKLLSLDCGMCIPNKMEHNLQRKESKLGSCVKDYNRIYTMPSISQSSVHKTHQTSI